MKAIFCVENKNGTITEAGNFILYFRLAMTEGSSLIFYCDGGCFFVLKYFLEKVAQVCATFSIL